MSESNGQQMSAPRVIGIDPSLTSTGLADSLGNSRRVQIPNNRIAGNELLDDHNRIERIALAVTDFATALPADLVVIEGPAFSRSNGHAHTRAGLWWLIVDRLISGPGQDGRPLDLPVMVVPPTCRAMYATGKGNAGKDQVLAAAIKRYPSFEVTGNDVADAVILAAIGARLLGHPIEESLPQTNMRALDKLALPPGVK